ncbi:hypothetical protein CXG81DRAFT_27404 [Caulochytrium protostelioides]|uniref:EF-hand domain-containing protein n=1 Tax=Caulochytrium protostelioides TaxID=1555241 RepID=A0A4P9X472_9FUNG|nr:hypothetical protein CXG81DRAFT_27404 [Caulochytrium protostelioides]|eukprot:RKO99866.1 hypothetical protein CXG81DRAFT_27404 [Caulochytrium protostelioides]
MPPKTPGSAGKNKKSGKKKDAPAEPTVAPTPALISQTTATFRTFAREVVIAITPPPAPTAASPAPSAATASEPRAATSAGSKSGSAGSATARTAAAPSERGSVSAAAASAAAAGAGVAPTAPAPAPATTTKLCIEVRDAPTVMRALGLAATNAVLGGWMLAMAQHTAEAAGISDRTMILQTGSEGPAVSAAAAGGGGTDALSLAAAASSTAASCDGILAAAGVPGSTLIPLDSFLAVALPLLAGGQAPVPDDEALYRALCVLDASGTEQLTTDELREAFAEGPEGFEVGGVEMEEMLHAYKGFNNLEIVELLRV